jgi:hypothetical protein
MQKYPGTKKTFYCTHLKRSSDIVNIRGTIVPLEVIFWICNPSNSDDLMDDLMNVRARPTLVDGVVVTRR